MKLLNERLKEYEPLFREYHIVEQVGRGGSGHVFRAESPSGHLTAIKVISIPSTDEWEAVGGTDASGAKVAALAKRSEELLQKTRHEYECAQKLERSDYTVKVLDIEEKHFSLLPNSPIMGTDVFIRMDWQDRDLEQQLQDQSGAPFSQQEILKVGYDVVSALIDLHAAQIKHRDVKPRNIFVNEYRGRRYKLGDFGSSRIVTGNTMGAIPSAGTRGFMAPEELGGHPEFSSDLYSLGIVLYWMAAGAVPGPGVGATKWVRPQGLSDGIWSVIQTACAEFPDERFFSATEMRDAIQEAELDNGQPALSDRTVPQNEKMKEEKPNMNKATTNATTSSNRKGFSRLGFMAFLAAILFLAVCAIGILTHTLRQPVSEAEFEQTYYTQNDMFDNMQSDYNFDIKTDGKVKGAYLGISAPSVLTVPSGGEVSVTLTYTGDVAHVWFGRGSMVLNNFCATTTIRQISDNEIKILLTNVQTAQAGKDSPKSISITGGTGASPKGDLTNNVTSSEFMIAKPFLERLLDTVNSLWPFLLILGLALLGFALYTRKGQKN